jgi:uncharacterized protein YbjT (DUF2867 family)
MKRVLITGGTGVLGRELTPRLQAVGYTVRVMSRRPAKPGEDDGVEWAQASLEEGTGLAEAVDGADIIIHTASSPVKRGVDVDGTGRLLEKAAAAGVEHFVYISIVGIEKIDYSYYKNKLAAERLIEASAVPYSILRATQFHELVDRLLPAFTRLPLAFIPKNWQFQTISAAEVAEHLVAVVEAGPSGRLPDIGGPEVLRLEEMARSWLAAQGKRKAMVHLPVPGGLSAGFRAALNTIPESRNGKITWSQWLESRYGNPAGVEGVTAPENAIQGKY